jgi:hypothetical protein
MSSTSSQELKSKYLSIGVFINLRPLLAHLERLGEIDFQNFSGVGGLVPTFMTITAPPTIYLSYCTLYLTITASEGSTFITGGVILYPALLSITKIT